jgi:glycosyltransferase involved in cell wall biosynthesis
MKQLAIIIPAYKSKYLRQTIDCLVNQTNQNFNLYIGDDNSPFNLKEIVNDYNDKLTITYHRFSNNIGGKNIVNQWNRCVELIKDEKWIWLFSDDDIADTNCVETFYKTIKMDSEKYDVYRFNTRVIDDNNEIICDNESPFEENAFDMCLDILQLKRGHCMPDHIFSKRKYNQLGGFVFTNYAQAADWATSINFATEKGICSMPNAKVNWRYGTSSISGNAHKDNHDKVIGHIQFINWVLSHFKSKVGNKDFEKLKLYSNNNLIRIIQIHYKGITLKTSYQVLKTLIKTDSNLFKNIISTFRLIKIK